MSHSQIALSLVAAILATLMSAGLIWATRPLLRQAIARPNERSSHRVPTPQGAGIGVIAATLTVAGAVIMFGGAPDMTIPIAVFGATLFIVIVGFVDDVTSIPVLPRLVLQGLAVAAIVFTAADNLRIIPACPLWIERAFLLLAGLWFVNLVNFMDGLDLMTVTEAVPITAAVALLGWLGGIPASTTIVAAALCGAMLGFSPFNRPVAKIFLGDVGSLPIGLLLGWCLLQLAWHGQLAAAVLLPLYYLTDATVTLSRRILSREEFWVAHRTHYYQRATDIGFTVWRVVGELFVLNVILAALAVISTRMPRASAAQAILVAIGVFLVLLLMFRFSGRLRLPSRRHP
jgi:UDP-N-acetylmuramyl pentapeptide phosphotransferase/UDP-N-acetylglucosamine-1-phosphate transferase